MTPPCLVTVPFAVLIVPLPSCSHQLRCRLGASTLLFCLGPDSSLLRGLSLPTLGKSWADGDKLVTLGLSYALTPTFSLPCCKWGDYCPGLLRTPKFQPENPLQAWRVGRSSYKASYARDLFRGRRAAVKTRGSEPWLPPRTTQEESENTGALGPYPGA